MHATHRGFGYRMTTTLTWAALAFAALLLGPVVPAQATYMELIEADNPFAYYRLDESGTGDGTVIADSSGNGVDLTAFNGVALQQPGIPGIFNSKSAGFNGTDTYIRDAIASRFVKPDITMSLWINPSSLSGTQYLLGSMGDGTAGCCYRWRMFTTGDKLGFTLADSALVTITSTDSLLSNQWNHIAATWETGGLNQIWINGQLQPTDTDATLPGSFGFFQIGTRLWPDGDPLNVFDGLVDEVAFYDEVLSGSRIVQHFAVGLGAETFGSIVPEPTGMTIWAVLGVAMFGMRRRGRREGARS